jgi:hypothetical protein
MEDVSDESADIRFGARGRPDGTSRKRVGSRRYRAVMRDLKIERARFVGLNEQQPLPALPPERECVMVVYVCRNHPEGRPLGVFGLYTAPGLPRELWCLPVGKTDVGDLWPFQREQGHAPRVRLICNHPGCSIDVVRSPGNVLADLQDFWKPHSMERRVVPVPT